MCQRGLPKQSPDKVVVVISGVTVGFILWIVISFLVNFMVKESNQHTCIIEEDVVPFPVYKIM
jgi:hypothetical protein